MSMGAAAVGAAAAPGTRGEGSPHACSVHSWEPTLLTSRLQQGTAGYAPLQQGTTSISMQWRCRGMLLTEMSASVGILARL